MYSSKFRYVAGYKSQNTITKNYTKKYDFLSKHFLPNL